MEKAKNLVILILEIMLALGVIIFITLYIWSGSTEKTYQQVLSDIKAGKFENASTQIKTIPHYKDSNDISIYIYPISLFYKKYDNGEQQINGYRMALSEIKRVSPKLNNKTYQNDLEALSKVLEFKTAELKAQGVNIELDNRLADIEAKLKIGDIAGAGDQIQLLDKPSQLTLKNELVAYVTLINAENLEDNKAITEAIKGLDPNYSGKMSALIQKTVLKYVDSIKWNELYKKVEETKRPTVNLGMAKDQVAVLLGRPLHDSVIRNRYGSYETVEYENFGTLYFENGELSAYVESE